jgi:hypothetical protein
VGGPGEQGLVAGQEPVESQLKDSLREYINSEIVLQTVHTDADVLAWLRTTFLAVRMRHHHKQPRDVESALRELVASSLRDLTAIGLCEAEDDSSTRTVAPGIRRITPLQPGSIMSNFYVSFAVGVLRNHALLKG